MIDVQKLHAERDKLKAEVEELKKKLSAEESVANEYDKNVIDLKSLNAEMLVALKKMVKIHAIDNPNCKCAECFFARCVIAKAEESK